MIDICFGDSEYGLLKWGLKKNDIFMGYPNLSMGKIPLDDFEKARKRWINEFFSGCSCWKKIAIARNAKQSLKKIIKKAKKGDPVRIWVASSPDSMCGYYHMVHQLQGKAKQIFVMEMPDNLGYRERGYDKSWAELNPFEIQDVMHLQRKLSQRERDRIAEKWEQLATENTDLRLRLGGTIKSVAVDFLDDEIYFFAPKGEFKFANLVGTMLGRSKHAVSDSFVTSRIWSMIDNGQFKVIQGLDNPGDHNSNVILSKSLANPAVKKERDYYDYSVKEILTNCFPENTIWKMRTTCVNGNTDRNMVLPLAWIYADQEAVSAFSNDIFLEDTVLYDDYIAYFVRKKTEKAVFLSFLHFENQLPFDLDTKYAFDLAEDWTKKGYRSFILRNCVGFAKLYNGVYHFFSHSCANMGMSLLKPVVVNGQYLFVIVKDPFWNHATAMVFFAMKSALLSKYECIFSDDAALERCGDRSNYDKANWRYEDTETIALGLKSIKDYFDGKNKIEIAYIKKKGDAAFDTNIIADGNKYILTIGSKNQIPRIIEEKIEENDQVILVPEDQLPAEIPMPKIIKVRPLDIQQTRSYGIRISCDDGNEKNYYLMAFESDTIPKSVSVDGVTFDPDILASVRIATNGISFSNGYFIPSHLLYYRSISQLIPEKIDTVAYKGDSFSIQGTYKMPLSIRNYSNKTLLPHDNEYYGAHHTLIDERGNRISDYSGLYFEGRDCSVLVTRSEANNKIGYINKENGKWLIPPIFDKGEELRFGNCGKAFIGEKQYLVNVLGEVIPFDYPIETDLFSDYYGENACRFSAEEYNGKITRPEEERFEELMPGLWGYIDHLGKIIVKPQYVFATDFGICNEKCAFVARLVNGQPLWGLIDLHGNEIIPCMYPNLGTHSGTAVNFQRKPNGLYGIMDFKGNVIMEPRYKTIYEYNQNFNLIAAGKEWNQIGVARVDSGEIVVPFQYQYIGFEEWYIECEKEDGECNYYDYNGTLLFDDPYEYILRKTKEGYIKKIGEKWGMTDENGNEKVPFIFDQPRFIEYYTQGFIVTGVKGQYGLTTIDGKELLEEKYTEIKIDGVFVYAFQKSNAGKHIVDELFLTDGTKVFNGLSKNIEVSDTIITRETPSGKEFYKIVRQ